MRHLQGTTDLQFARLPFSRVVREILSADSSTAGRTGNVNRIQAAALEALQEAAESRLVLTFESLFITGPKTRPS
jgi:histone H3/H4